MIALHEIEPGTWIVPELVTGVRVNNAGFVLLSMVGGGEIRLNNYYGTPEKYVDWIDARRIEPLSFVALA